MHGSFVVPTNAASYSRYMPLLHSAIVDSSRHLASLHLLQLPLRAFVFVCQLTRFMSDLVRHAMLH